MLYATYSKGYRIGGPNSVAPCPNPLPNDPDGDNINNTQLPCGLPNEVQYGPDNTKNAEIGIRTQWRSAERRVGKESVGTCRYRMSPYNEKITIRNTT